MPMRIFLVGLLLVLVACSDSPTGRNQLILFSDARMSQMGASSFSQLKQQGSLNSDAGLVDYVQCISEALLEAAGEPPARWEVRVFNDDSPNAFALPGRKIGVHTGMIELAQTPGQLAAVIGHEIGHVQARHGAERASLSVAADVGRQLAEIGLQDNENAPVIMAALGIGSQLGVLLPYSRTHESEADRIGLELMARAGFDPSQALALWRNMAAAKGGQSVPEFLSTHPADQTRIERLAELLGNADAVYRQAQVQARRPDCQRPDTGKTARKAG